MANFFNFLSGVDGFIGSIWHSGGIPDWRIALAVFFAMALYFGSAFAAATIAELTGHGVARHFMLGLALPWIYPLYLARNIDIREISASKPKKKATGSKWKFSRKKEDMTLILSVISEEREQRRRERIASRHLELTGNELSGEELDRLMQTDKEATKTILPAETTGDDAMSAVALQIHGALQALEPDADGVRNGDFLLSFEDGTHVKTNGILSMKKDFMVCAMAGTGKTMRIRYDKLNGIEQL